MERYKVNNDPYFFIVHHDLLLEALRHVPLLPKKLSVGGENLSLLSMRNDVDDATTETTRGKSLLESWVTTFLHD